MDRVAFATHRKQPAIAADDAPVVPHLGSLRVEGIPWGAPVPVWMSYAAVIIRSCWDYHLAPDAFLRWIDALDEAGVPLLNPPAALRWNTDKRYLLTLEAYDCPIIPTVYVDASAPVTLADVLARQGWKRAVVKPAVSANAYRTFVTTPEEAPSHQQSFDAARSGGGALVQRFADEVIGDGEWSLVFFEGVFSHAVVKRPSSGDYRVQETFGGTAEPAVPSPGIVAAARRILEAARNEVGTELLYARVDGILHAGTFRLMELELIEPVLFLRSSHDAAARFAHAIQQRVQALPPRLTSDVALNPPANI